MSKLFLASPKAGVGKTTAAVNLGAAAAQAGNRVLLVDCDPAGGAIKALNLGESASTLSAIGIASAARFWQSGLPNLDVTSPYGMGGKPAHTLEEFLNLIQQESGFRAYGTVLFDTPAILAPSQVTALLRTADEAVLVIRADPTALKEVHPFLQLVKRVQDQGFPVQFRGLLLNLPSGEPIGGSWETELRRAFALSLLPHAIPYDPEVGRSTALGRPIVSANPGAPAARQYTALAQVLGLVPTEGDAVDLFSPPAAATTDLGGVTPEQVRDALGDEVPELAKSLTRITRPASKRTGGTPGLPSVAEESNMNSPDSSGPLENPNRGHTGDVTAVAFAPDGRTIVTASWDKTIKVWDVHTGIETATLSGHSGVISALAFSPDGALLASTSWDKTARLWRLATREPVVLLKGHAGVVTSVAFSPRGDLIATGGWDKAVRLWRPDGEAVAVLSGHVRMVTSVAISPDGRLVASGSWDRTIKLWNPNTSTCTTTLLGHAGDVTSVAFSPNGKRIASGSLDHTVRLWDASNGREVNVLRGHGGEVTSVAFSADGHHLASSGWDRVIKIWDAETGHLVASLSGHTGVVTSLAFSPDGQTIASSSLDRTVKLWDVNTGAEASSIRVQSSNEARAAGTYNPRETPSVKGPADAEETRIHAPSQSPTPIPPTIARPEPTPPKVEAPRPPVAPAPIVRTPPPTVPEQPAIAMVPSAVGPGPAPAPPPKPVVPAPTTATPTRPAPPAPKVPPLRNLTPPANRGIPTPTPPIVPPPPEEDSFVDAWSHSPGAPLLEDILGPSLGPRPFVVPSTPRPNVPPPSQPAAPIAESPKSLRFGDLVLPPHPLLLRRRNPNRLRSKSTYRTCNFQR